MTKRVTYTNKYAQFDAYMVGKTDEIKSCFADELIRKGYATEYKEVMTPLIGLNRVKLSNEKVKNAIKRVSKKGGTIAYMATFPSREENIKKALLSIYKQVDEVVVVANGSMEIPKLPNVTVYNTLDLFGDIGCLAKFLFAHEFNGYIFTIDDDFIYPEDYVKKSIEKLKMYGNKVVLSYHGRVLHLPTERYKGGQKEFYQCTKDVDNDVSVHILGTGVMCFHSSVFVFPYDIKEHSYSNCSDIQFSISLDTRSIPMIVGSHKAGWLVDLDNEVCISRGNKNDAFLADMINRHNWNDLKDASFYLVKEKKATKR
jgi:hypothetical protein